MSVMCVCMGSKGSETRFVDAKDGYGASTERASLVEPEERSVASVLNKGGKRKRKSVDVNGRSGLRWDGRKGVCEGGRRAGMGGQREAWKVDGAWVRVVTLFWRKVERVVKKMKMKMRIKMLEEEMKGLDLGMGMQKGTRS